MMVGYIYILSKRNTKASKDLFLDYKPNANEITTIHGPSLTYAGHRQEGKRKLNQTGTLLGHCTAINKTYPVD